MIQPVHDPEPPCSSYRPIDHANGARKTHDNGVPPIGTNVTVTAGPGLCYSGVVESVSSKGVYITFPDAESLEAQNCQCTPADVKPSRTGCKNSPSSPQLNGTISSAKSDAERQEEEQDQTSYFERIQLLRTDEAKKVLLYGLQGSDAQCMVDFLDKLLFREALSARDRRHALYILSKIAKSAQVFPARCQLEGVRYSFEGLPEGRGGYGEIFKGMFHGQPVGVKVVHLGPGSNRQSMIKALAMELALGVHIHHENILQFHGFFMAGEAKGRVCLVSSWMSGGNLLDYTASTAYEYELAIPLIADITLGLQYLHDLDIVHSDLKAENILLTRDKRAILGDFGISQILMTMATAKNGPVGTSFWTAPEFILNDDQPSTKPSDIYSFACTCYEILARKRPFHHMAKYERLMFLIIRNNGEVISQKPDIELDGFETIWKMMMSCWKRDPKERLTIEEICNIIKMLYSNDPRPPMNPNTKAALSKVKASVDSVEVNYTQLHSILSQIEGR